MFGRSKIAIRKEILVRNYRTLIQERYIIFLRVLGVLFLSLVLVIPPYLWVKNRFEEFKVKSSLASRVFQRSGYDLKIGQIEWIWLPSFGFRIQEARISLPGSNQVLLSADEVIIHASMWGIASPDQRIVINGIGLTGVQVALLEADEEVHNWVFQSEDGLLIKVPFQSFLTDQAQSDQIAIQSPATDAVLPVVIQLDWLALNAARFSYDLGGHLYQLALDDLQLNQIQTMDRIAIEATGVMEREGWPKVGFNLPAVTNLTSAARPVSQEEAVSDIQTRIIEINPTRREAIRRPQADSSEEAAERRRFAVHIKDGKISFDDQPAHQFNSEINMLKQEIQLTLSLQGDVNLKLSDMTIGTTSEAFNLDGQIRLATDYPAKLAELARVSLPAAMEQLGIEGHLRYTSEGFSLSNASLELNNQHFTGSLNWLKEQADLSQTIHKLKLDLTGDRLNLNPWPQEVLLPFQLPDNYRWELLLQLGRLDYVDLTVQGIGLQGRSDGQRGLINMTVDQLLGGLFDLQIAVDLTTEQTLWQSRFNVQGADSKVISDWLGLPFGLAARLDFSGQSSLQGNDLAGLAQSTRINAKFSAKDGEFMLGGIKANARELAYLSGDQALIEAWPDQLSFGSLEGTLQIGEGSDKQFFLARMDNLEIKAAGAINPFQRLMDLNVGFIIHPPPEGETPLIEGETPLIGGYLQDIEWPMVCMGLYQSNWPCRLAYQPVLETILDQVKKKKSRRFWLDNSTLDFLDEDEDVADLP